MADVQLATLGGPIKQAYEGQPLTLLGNTTSRSLASGAGTITLSTMRFELSGTATASFNVTIANGTTLGQLVRISVTGDPAGHSIELRDAAGGTLVGGIVKDAIYWFRWNDTAW